MGPLNRNQTLYYSFNSVFRGKSKTDHNTESPAKYRKNLTKLENMGFIWKF